MCGKCCELVIVVLIGQKPLEPCNQQDHWRREWERENFIKDTFKTYVSTSSKSLAKRL